jgi:hypothetical protein
MCILETERTLTILWPAWPHQAVPPIPKPPGIVRLSQMHIATYEQTTILSLNIRIISTTNNYQQLTNIQRCPRRRTAEFFRFFMFNLSSLRRCKSSAIWRSVEFPVDVCTETRQWRILNLNGKDDRKTDDIEYFFVTSRPAA